MASIGIDGGDHSDFDGASSDAKQAVIRLLEILPENRGQQLGCLEHWPCQLVPVEVAEKRVTIASQCIDERVARSLVVPVAHGLASITIVVLALQDATELRLERAVRLPRLFQQSANRCTD